MKRIFLICPVRGVDENESTHIAKYVIQKESEGHRVYWPYRDTNQDDPVGNHICSANRLAMESSDEIHVWWNGQSEGSLFDLGMAWALNKKIRLANDIKATDGQKSFNNLLRWCNEQA